MMKLQILEFSDDEDDRSAYEAQQERSQIPPPDLPKVQKTPEEQKADELFEEASRYLKKSKQAGQQVSIKHAYRLLDSAAALQHTKAKEYLGELQVDDVLFDYTLYYSKNRKWNKF